MVARHECPCGRRPLRVVLPVSLDLSESLLTEAAARLVSVYRDHFRFPVRSEKGMKTMRRLTNNLGTILSVSPMAEDHTALAKILQGKWKRLTTSGLQWATKLLRRNQIPITICERDLQPGSWKDLLEQTAIMPHSPLLIVTSRSADESLWAEVLNLGGWDVLAKPFDRTEVIRVIEAAWRHWKDHHERTTHLPLRVAG